ncbi:MAG: hypothetical protein AVDCRST_MAG16-270, partial [uncultured Frankineae bacterium]
DGRAAGRGRGGRTGVRQRRRGRPPARRGRAVRPAEPRIELPRAARLAGQPRRQPRPPAPAVPARGDRGLAGARLRQGDRWARGRRRARPRRADARLDGRVRRVLRPHTGAGARGQRTGRPGAAAAGGLDALGHDAGSAGPRLRGLGRRAGHAGGVGGRRGPRPAARPLGAPRTRLRVAGRRRAGGRAGRPALPARSRAARARAGDRRRPRCRGAL